MISTIYYSLYQNNLYKTKNIKYISNFFSIILYNTLNYTMNYQLDLMEVLRRAAKYLVEGGAVAMAAYLIPKNKLKLEEILMLAVTAAAVFAILELYSPAIGASARAGAGLSLGAGVVGGVPVMR